VNPYLNEELSVLLRRVIEHVQRQNWFAVAIDFVIVVFGVFMGIQVANWNEARSDRQDEARYLRAMAEDVQISLGKGTQVLADLERQQNARAELLERSTSGDWDLSSARLDELILNGLFFSTPISIEHVTFETLKSSGQFALIGNQTLQAELQSLGTRIGELKASQNDEIGIVHDLSDPMLVEHFDLRSVFQANRDAQERPLAWLPDHPASNGIPEYVKSVGFANVLIYRSYLAQSKIRFLKAILEQEKYIAQLIGRRLAVLDGIR
jgi:hypothetical protein